MQNSGTLTEESFKDFLLYEKKENSLLLKLKKLPNT